ncbi:hypothetical protein [Roseivivax halotolerans]|uniref:hypothetical protein n=1 Tax=Roseivivax halotolerans TaxID=93684 RepID=UPI0015873E71|nr:hypothetical protein [Roseivivax halotolerans]
MVDHADAHDPRLDRQDARHAKVSGLIGQQPLEVHGLLSKLAPCLCKVVEPAGDTVDVHTRRFRIRQKTFLSCRPGGSLDRLDR